MQHYQIRPAQMNDIEAVKKLANANRHALGFVRRASLRESCQRGWLLVAQAHGQVIGFCHFRHCKSALRTTIYELCVEQQWRGQGIGRALVEEVKRQLVEQGLLHLQLKAGANLPANAFYEHIGLQYIREIEGRQPSLKLWQWWPAA